MPPITLLAQYPRQDLTENQIAFEAEQDWTNRPAWIRLDTTEPLPRFLSIQVPKHGEIIYKSFGKYYYPFDYTNEEERRFMDGMASEYDDMVGNAFNIPMAKTLLEHIPLERLNPSDAVLDLGCGTGIFSHILATRGYKNLTLVDFSQGMLGTAQSKDALQTARFVQADVTKEIPAEKYSLVVSVMLFNTFDEEKTEQVFHNLLPNLRPGAIIAVLEDTEKVAYSKYLQPLFSGMVDVADRTKFVFVGALRAPHYNSGSRANTITTS